MSKQEPVKKSKQVLTYAFGVLLLLAGITHFLKPVLFYPFIPEVLPQKTINMLAGCIEIAAGISVFIPRLRPPATFTILALMLLFLPLHAWDVFRAHPAIGSHTLALVRLPLQFVLIGWAWYIHRK